MAWGNVSLVQLGCVDISAAEVASGTDVASTAARAIQHIVGIHGADYAPIVATTMRRIFWNRLMYDRPASWALDAACQALVVSERVGHDFTSQSASR